MNSKEQKIKILYGNHASGKSVYMRNYISQKFGCSTNEAYLYTAHQHTDKWCRKASELAFENNALFMDEVILTKPLINLITGIAEVGIEVVIATRSFPSKFIADDRFEILFFNYPKTSAIQRVCLKEVGYLNY